MDKRYKAKTVISVNISLSSGKSLHVAFTPLSDGSSEYVTGSEEVQNGLEKHWRFGSLFRVDEVTEQYTAAQQDSTADTQDEGEEETGLKQIKVSDLGSAKDYLADNFGYTRTQLSSKAKIIQAAASKGIEFVGLEQA